MDHTHAPTDRGGDFGPQTQQVSAFLRRLESLEFEDLGGAIRTWRAELSDGWHEADRAVAAAIRDSGRHKQQEALLEALYDVFRRAPWFSPEQPGARIASSDATAQYIATAALLALLVCDVVPPKHFQELYRPFAALIPLSDLGGHGDRHSGSRPRDDRPGAS